MLKSINMLNLECIQESVAQHGMPAIRVSAAGFADIRHPDGIRHGLLRHTRGGYTPVGGSLAALQLHEGRLPVAGMYVTPESDQDPKDLRFNLPDCPASIVTFLKWFIAGEGREGREGVLREVIEELGPEESGPLTEDEVESVEESHLTLIGMHATIRPGSNPISKGCPTLAVSEIYEASFPLVIVKKLGMIASSEGHDPQFIFVTPLEIRDGRSEAGLVIGSVAQSLLDHEPHYAYQ